MKTVIYYCKQTSQCGNRINSYRGLQGEDTERPTTGSIRKAGGKRYGGKEKTRMVGEGVLDILIFYYVMENQRWFCLFIFLRLFGRGR